MKNGKVSQNVLKRSVLKQLHNYGSPIAQGPGAGMDFAAIDGDPNRNLQIVASVQTVLPCRHDLAYRSVCAAAANVFAAGAEIGGVLVSLCVPTLWNESQIRELMRDIDQACSAFGIAVLGGHTQASRRVSDVILTVTAIGTVPEDRVLVKSDGAKPGMDILITKWIAMEATALLAAEKKEVLLNRFSNPFLQQAENLGKMLSIRREAAVAVKAGAAAMHDVSEGGIFGALWEMAEASGVGLEIDLKKIPIRQETVEITEVFDLNPYKLLSGGCLLIAAEDGNRMLRDLEDAGIAARIIGRTTDSNDRVLVHDGERRFLETVQTDEIYKVFEE